MNALVDAQRTSEWFAARAGKVTASRINDVMARIKSGEAASRRQYKWQLAIERLTQTPALSYSNAAMQWGTDMEPVARQAYEFHTLDKVTETGFVLHPDVEMSGASPDGLVGEDGLIEIKCPESATHGEWLLDGVCPAKHIGQIQWQLACTNRTWCDFVSYDPRFPEKHRLFIVRVVRDDELIENIKSEVIVFLNEVAEIVDKIEARSER
jgi:putative phage-type endonuclease